MKRLTHILVCCLFLAFSPLLKAQQWHTSLDIMHPAQNTLPEKVLDILLVNNVKMQPDIFGHTTRIGEQNTHTLSIDLHQAPLNVLLGATQTLDFGQIFSNVGLLLESQNTASTFVSHPLPKDSVIALCYEYQTDALLTCNQIRIFDVLNIDITDDYTYLAVLEAYINTHWALQLPDGSEKIYFTRDTLYWENEATTAEGALNGLPNRQQALLDMSRYVGEKFASSFLPTWESVDRYLYENKDDAIQQGLQAFTHKHWDDAIALWQPVYEQNKSTKRKNARLSAAYAAANIAVTYEIQDNLQAAQQWAQQAYEAFKTIDSAEAIQQAYNLLYYTQQLSNRQKEHN